ncbi:MAG TPA: HipA domain-containing protein [Arenibaculum sp.]|nr:HipA domain-containing protein [Arenibaculum sp.]
MDDEPESGLRSDGTCRGMEDFCVLNGLSTSRKYSGSYEKAVFRRLKEYMAQDTEAWLQDAESLFTLVVLNCAVRNGDAMSENLSGMAAYAAEHPGFAEIASRRTVRAARSALIEIGQALGSYRDSFVVIGGSVSWPRPQTSAGTSPDRMGLTPWSAAWRVRRPRR